MPRSKTQDISYGLESEQEMLPRLQEKFGEDLVRSAKQFSPYDYRMTGVRVELKTRNNTSDRYDTTMVGVNKMVFAKNFYGKYYFVFAFTDGVKYIRYNEDKFKHYEQKEGGRWDRGRVESNNYVYIPVADLKDL